MNKNRVGLWLYWSVFVAFVIANVADAVTALMALQLFDYESNPVYTSTGSIVLPILLKLGIIILFFAAFKYKKFSSRWVFFMMLSSMVFSTFMILLGVASNVYAIVQLQTITQTALKSGVSVSSLLPAQDANFGRTVYLVVVGFSYVIPLLLNGFIFLVYRFCERDIEFKNKW